ncbi:hypothetical protein YC2023_005175 [Brassica napus]
MFNSNILGCHRTIPEEDEVTNGREVDKVGRDEERVDSEEVRKEVEKEKEVHNQLVGDVAVEYSSLKILDADKGNWSDVSPSKQGPSISKKNGDSIISSPSRFAILSEDQEESGNNLQEEDKESEEGDIVEDQTNESLEDRSRKEK